MNLKNFNLIINKDIKYKYKVFSYLKFFKNIL